MFIYVKPWGYEGKEVVTVGTYDSLLAIVEQYENIEVVCVAGTGEKILRTTCKHMEMALKSHRGRRVNSFIKPVIWRYPFLEDEQNLWREEEHGEVTTR